MFASPIVATTMKLLSGVTLSVHDSIDWKDLSTFFIDVTVAVQLPPAIASYDRVNQRALDDMGA